MTLVPGKRVGAVPLVIVLAALLLASGYSAFAANEVGQDFERGRAELVTAQSTLSAGQRSADESAIRSALSQLQAAEQAFANGRRRTQSDPALRVLGALPGSGLQVEATARLGVIGIDLSRAGESAAGIALWLAGVEQQAQRPLTVADLRDLLQQAAAIATSYQRSIAQIRAQLDAAHAERAGLSTANLVPPLRHAYDEVDRALEVADTAFRRYEDVKQVLDDFLGVNPSG